MATKQLDFIANTPVRNRQPVMPRIYCKDRVSLSVQASSQHYAPTKANPGIARGDDEGPWIALEVAYLSIPVPFEWQAAFVESHWSAFKKHDRGSVPDDDVIANPIYCLDVEEIRRFIEDHGGEAEGAELLRLQVLDKFAELRRAVEEETAIWSQIDEASEKNANPAFAARIMALDYNRAFDTVRRLTGEWQALRLKAQIAYTDELTRITVASLQTSK